MDKKFLGGALFFAMMAPYMVLRLMGRAIAWLWIELGELDDDALIIRGIVVAGIITSGVTAYGHYFVEPHGFMTTEWQMWVALGAVALGGATLLMLAVIIGGGLSRWIATFHYGPAVLLACSLVALGVIGLLDMPENTTTYTWLMATVALPGFLALGAAGHQHGWWYEVYSEEFVEDDGEPTP